MIQAIITNQNYDIKLIEINELHEGTERELLKVVTEYFSKQGYDFKRWRQI